MRIEDGQRALFYVYSGLDIVYEKGGATATRHCYANGLHNAEYLGGTLGCFHKNQV